MKKIYSFLTALLFLGAFSANAQFNNIYSFGATAYPYADVTVVGNKLFGACDAGGANGRGFFFSINRDGTGFKDIWDCSDTGTVGNANGGYPYGDVIYMNHRLYGFTDYYGGNGYGTLFSIDTNGSGYKDLYDFSPSTGGFLGWGTLTLIGNKFFGGAAAGGANSLGSLFSIDTNGTGFTDLHDFTGSATDGAYPYDVHLEASGNKLFGITYNGGASDSGMVFSMDTDGTHFKDILDMNVSTGSYPEGHLLLWGTKLFGMSIYGGSSDSGTIFSVDTSGSNFKILKNLNYLSGDYPYGSLTKASNKLWGMNYYGGANNLGTIISVDSDGSNFMDMHDFNGSDGEYPEGNNLILAGDTLYGMTWGGGANLVGNIFSYIDTSIVTAVKHLNQSKGLVSVYPNPNHGNFTVGINAIKGLDVINVYNALGQMVYSQNLTKTNTQINLMDQAKGVYLYRVIAQNGSIVSEGKFVIQ